MKAAALSAATACLFAFAAPAGAGFLDQLGKEVLKDLGGGSKQENGSGEQRPAGKTELIVSGAADLLAGAAGVPYETEVVIGQSLALEAFGRFGLPVSNDALQRYVNLVGTAVARNSPRPDIPYSFVVVDSGIYNAFACPGGIIFVSAALVRLMNDESELANILAHEVAHVAHMHAMQSIRRANFLSGAAKLTAANMKGSQGQQFQSVVGDLQGVLFDKGLDKKKEFEADLTAMDTAYRTGYDPRGMIRVLETLKEKEAGAEKKGSWFSTHPPLAKRLQKTRKHLKNYPDASRLAQLPQRFSPYRQKLK